MNCVCNKHFMERLFVTLQKVGMLVFFLAVAVPALAQGAKPALRKMEQDTIVLFKDRWSIRTNAVDWLLTIPNISVEFDISNSVYNKYTLSLEGKYNWQTSHNYLPSTILNLWEIRPEVRKYWRTEYRANTGTEPSLKERLFSRQRKKPRYWRAYYLGIYAHAGGYGFKFGHTGVQGNFYGAGVSGGYSIPLYSYRENYVDIEFGGSVGIVAASTDRFALDRENNAYVPSGESKGMHIIPFPVVSDMRVSFIYRFKSIKDKYKRTDYAKIQAKELKRMEKKRLKDSIRTAEQLADSLRELRRVFVKDSIRQAKVLQDSLQELRKTFVKDSIARAKVLQDSLQEAQSPVGNDTIARTVLPTDSVSTPILPIMEPILPTDTIPADTVKPIIIPVAEPILPADTIPADTVKPIIIPVAEPILPTDTIPTDTVKPVVREEETVPVPTEAEPETTGNPVEEEDTATETEEETNAPVQPEAAMKKDDE